MSDQEDPTSTLDPLDGEGEELSFTEIYKQLTINEDLILVVDEDVDKAIRKGLAAAKHNANEAARKAGDDSLVEDRRIEFLVLPWTPAELLDNFGRIKLQIFLKERNKVKVHRIIVPDKF